MNKNSYLLLGGAGLVGRQVAELIARELQPEHIIISSLRYSDALNTVHELESQFVGQPIKWASAGGNIFVRSEFADMPRYELIDNPEFRGLLFE
ncbi:MAG: short-chain dehydrogenase, partial [Anaerolineae bacterium]|nr:short-chain dehydrogenase [Anaerolineae bacterium]